MPGKHRRSGAAAGPQRLPTCDTADCQSALRRSIDGTHSNPSALDELGDFPSRNRAHAETGLRRRIENRARGNGKHGIAIPIPIHRERPRPPTDREIGLLKTLMGVRKPSSVPVTV